MSDEPDFRREDVEVAAWRIKCLVEAGYDADVAGQLAADPLVDLHTAVDMKVAGCPQKLVLKILT